MSRASPPTIPASLVDRLGPPEEIFSPNTRFRKVSTIAGVLFIVLGTPFVVGGIVDRVGGGQFLGAGGNVIYMWLGLMLISFGFLAAVLTRMVPKTWVIVCSRGLARVRGDNWEAVEWSKIARVNDATITGLVTIEQIVVILADGRDWGILGNHVNNLPRLLEVLRGKMAERSPDVNLAAE